MKARTLGGLIALALVVAAFTWWSLRASTSQSPIAPDVHDVPSDQKRSDSKLDPAGDPVGSRRIANDASTDGKASNSSSGTASTPAANELSVLVLDASTHAPLPGMSVELHSNSPADPLSSDLHEATASARNTDEHGRASFSRDIEGPVDLRAWDPNETLGSVVRNIPSLADVKEKEIVLELSPKNDLFFWMRILDQETHTPISGAHATRIVPVNPIDPTHRFITDASGLFLVREMSWVVLPVQLDVPEHSMVFVQPVDGHEVPEKALDIEVWRSATVRVLVLDPAGAAAANVHIRLATDASPLWRPEAPHDWSNPFFPDWTFSTDADGRATISDVPANVAIKVEVQVTPTWSPSEPLTLKPGEVREVRWNVGAGCRVHGLVLDQNGSAVARCEVWVQKTIAPYPAYFEDIAFGKPAQTARTDEQGRFTFQAVGAGMWQIGPGRVKHGAEGVLDDVAPLAQGLVIAETQNDADVELRVDRGLFVRGRIEPPAGKELGEGSVVATDIARHLIVFEPWNADGTFALGPLMHGAFELQADSNSGLGSSTEMPVEAGQSDLLLQLKPGASLSGRVVDEKGDPIGCQIRVARREENGFSNMTITGVPTGEEFHFIGLPAGMFDIFAATSDGKFGRLEALDVAEGSSREGLVLRVVSGGRVRVRYESSEDEGIVDVLVNDLPVADGRIERGKAIVFTAPSGSVHIRLVTSGDDPIRERDVKVDVGVTTDVVIDYGAH